LDFNRGESFDEHHPPATRGPSPEIAGTRFRITLGPDFIGDGAEESADFHVWVRDVLFGPFDFWCNLRSPTLQES